jgi:hypothetical protein
MFGAPAEKTTTYPLYYYFFIVKREREGGLKMGLQ